MITLSHEADFDALHQQSLLPTWHECQVAHEHHWTLRLEVFSQDILTEDESTRVHLAFAQFDIWVDAHLSRHRLNQADESLRENCGARELGRWVYGTWAGRVPYLAAVHVRGPLTEIWSHDSLQRRERYEVTYRPKDDPSYGRYPLDNDNIHVSETHWTSSVLEMGPADDRTTETVKVLTLRFTDGHTPYTRWVPGNTLTRCYAPDAQLLRVQSLTSVYRYDQQSREWWAADITAASVYADETGHMLNPRREQHLSVGEWHEETPAWVQSLTKSYRPASDDAPPLPRTQTRS